MVACLSGIGVAYAIINPLKKLVAKMETALIEEEKPKKIKASNEIEALSVLFNRAFPSLDRLIKDKQILDNLPEGIIALAKDGKVTNLNIVLEETFGLKKSQAKGKHYSELFPESLENAPFFSLVEKLVKGELDRAEGEFRIAYKKDREGTFWITARNTEGGKEKVISFKDLLEMNRIRKQIKKTEQLALLGTLTSGLAHEVRNPLGSFRGMTELIQEDLAPGDEKRIYTRTMLREVDRLNQLVEDLLNYSTPPLSRMESININAVIGEALFISSYSFKEKNVETAENYTSDLPPISGDVERLTQAFLNLFTNAFEATPQGGRIEVGSRKSGIGDRRSELIVSITDTGCGIAPERLEKIFDFFYTTKKTGTGLGLPIARSIITAHGGNIEVKSRPGKGACFEVRLPLRGK